MPGFDHYDPEGTLTIAGFSMNRKAWGIWGDETGGGGLFQLITGGDRRGGDRDLPMSASSPVVPYPRRLTATVYELTLWVNGEVNHAGTLNTNAKDGLATNLDLIRSTLFEGATPATNGTLSASVLIPGWGTKTASIHMIAMEQQRYNYADDQSIWQGTLRISVPAGRFS